MSLSLSQVARHDMSSSKHYLSWYPSPHIQRPLPITNFSQGISEQWALVAHPKQLILAIPLPHLLIRHGRLLLVSPLVAELQQHGHDGPRRSKCQREAVAGVVVGFLPVEVH